MNKRGRVGCCKSVTVPPNAARVIMKLNALARPESPCSDCRALAVGFWCLRTGVMGNPATAINCGSDSKGSTNGPRLIAHPKTYVMVHITE